MPSAVALLNLARARLGPALTGFEVMGTFALRLVARHFPDQRVPFVADMAASEMGVLLELSDSTSEAHAREQLESLLQAALEQGHASDAVVAESLAQSRALWHVRESIPLAQVQEGLNIKHDISLPVSSVPAFCAQTEALLQRHCPGVRLVNFGHLGDGNLHYNVQAPEGMDAAAFLREQEATINHLVFDQVHALGGSISAEHGVGSLKADTLPQYKDPVALALMRRLKQALDPHGLLNPGRVLTLGDN
jgi:FAD/FMN-containing dehydrogenase